MFRWIHWGHYLRGRALARLGREVEAAQEYAAALRIEPGFVRAACALADLHARQGRFREAERWLVQTSLRAPRNAALLYNLGYVRERAGEPERAIEAFTQAVRLDPSLDRAWYGMGLAHAALGRYEESARALEEAATLQPENPIPWYQLGMAYHVLGQREKVKEIVHHILRFNPMMARRLIRDTGSTELEHLVKDLVG